MQASRSNSAHSSSRDGSSFSSRPVSGRPSYPPSAEEVLTLPQAHAAKHSTLPPPGSSKPSLSGTPNTSLNSSVERSGSARTAAPRLLSGAASRAPPQLVCLFLCVFALQSNCEDNVLCVWMCASALLLCEDKRQCVCTNQCNNLFLSSGRAHRTAPAQVPLTSSSCPTSTIFQRASSARDSRPAGDNRSLIMCMIKCCACA